ncbi:MAG: hypothetical protein WA958_20210 [Tunicatimonas sp.]
MKYSLLVALCMMTAKSWGQTHTVGARAAGLGHATVAMRGAGGLFANISGVTNVKQPTLFAGYENRFGFSEGLHTVAAGLVQPTRYGTGSVGVYRFGDARHSHHRLSLGYSQRIGQFSAGLRLSQHQYHTEGFGTRFRTVIDVGGQAQLSPELVFGMQLLNVTQARLSRVTQENIPTLVQVGLSYRPVTAWWFSAEVEHEVTQRPNLKLGVAYTALKMFSLRTGFNSRELRQFFGLGWKHRLLDADYALITHSRLGLSHQVSIAYRLFKNDR